MHGHLIDLTKVHRLNRLAHHIVVDVVEGQPIDTLRELTISQVKTDEQRLLRDIDRLLEKYDRIHEAAVAARPNHHVSLLMECSGLKSEMHDTANN